MTTKAMNPTTRTARTILGNAPILAMLAKGELTPSQIAAAIHAPGQTVRDSLRYLRAQDIVAARTTPPQGIGQPCKAYSLTDRGKDVWGAVLAFVTTCSTDEPSNASAEASA